MTRWQFAREVVAELTPWFLAFTMRVAVFMAAGFLAGHAAVGPPGAVFGAGLGGLVVSVDELMRLRRERP